MFQIHCPHCGVRDETDLHCGGEAHISRPAEPDALSDAEWADYLFHRSNPKGLQRELWFCEGCRKWFNVARDTVTHAIHEVYRIGAGGELAGELPRRTDGPQV